jgi:hypothetical protein
LFSLIRLDDNFLFTFCYLMDADKIASWNQEREQFLESNLWTHVSLFVIESIFDWEVILIFYSNTYVQFNYFLVDAIFLHLGTLAPTKISKIF